jgi:hypothetical protein
MGGASRQKVNAARFGTAPDLLNRKPASESLAGFGLQFLITC